MPPATPLKTILKNNQELLFDIKRSQVRDAVLEDYVSFMTQPGSHNDTYAESFHRSFFKDWVEAGKPTAREDLIKFVESRLELKFVYFERTRDW